MGDDGWVGSAEPRSLLFESDVYSELCLRDIHLGPGIALLKATGQVDPKGKRPGFQRRN